MKLASFYNRKKVKLSVANALPGNPEEALNQHKRSCIDALVCALEAMLL